MFASTNRLPISVSALKFLQRCRAMARVRAPLDVQVLVARAALRGEVVPGGVRAEELVDDLAS